MNKVALSQALALDPVLYVLQLTFKTLLFALSISVLVPAVAHAFDPSERLQISEEVLNGTIRVVAAEHHERRRLSLNEYLENHAGPTRFAAFRDYRREMLRAGRTEQFNEFIETVLTEEAGSADEQISISEIQIETADGRILSLAASKGEVETLLAQLAEARANKVVATFTFNGTAYSHPQADGEFYAAEVLGVETAALQGGTNISAFNGGDDDTCPVNEQRYAVLEIDFDNGRRHVSSGAAIDSRFNAGPKNLVAWSEYISGGRMKLAHNSETDVFPVEIEANGIDNTCHDYSIASSRALRKLRQDGVDISKYQGFIHLLPPAASCFAAAYGSLTDGHVWGIAGSAASVRVLAHELGHNFGFHHTSDCGRRGSSCDYTRDRLMGHLGENLLAPITLTHVTSEFARFQNTAQY